MGTPAAQDLDIQVPRNDAEAAKLLTERGRSALAQGHRLRANVEKDINAFASIQKLVKEFQKDYAKRQLLLVELQGAERVAKRLEDLLASSEAAPEETLSAIAQRAATFALSRRKAVMRVAPGTIGKPVRQAFGLHKAVQAHKPETILTALRALIAGRRKLPKSAAARLLTEEDVATAKALIKDLTAAQRQKVETKGEDSAHARDRDALHAGLELFYDLFGAASELVFENDQTQLVAARALIPHREPPKRRRKKKEGEEQKDGEGQDEQSADAKDKDAETKAAADAKEKKK